MKNLNRAFLLLLITFAFSFFAFMSAIHSQTNYYTTGLGSWTSPSNWSPSYPGESIAVGDTIFIRHVISISTTFGIDINGVLVNEPTGVLIGSKKITTQAGGHLINNGAISLNGEVFNYGSIYNSNWMGIKKMYVEGYLCNSGILSIDVGELIDILGGTIECGGSLIVDEIEVENDGTDIAYLQDINICKDSGGDPIINHKSGVIDSTTVEFCGRVLPVELFSYFINLKNNQVQIDWSTASEIDNDYFAIERSSDGYFFKDIARVQGVGNSESIQYYAITDEFPLEGVSYYRLKQVDFDGKVTYFDIKMVDNKDRYIDEQGLSVFPNPILKGSKFEIGLKGFENNNVQIRIQNMNGLTIHTMEYTPSSQRELIELPANIIQESGMYIVSVFSGSKWYNHKIMVIK